MESQGLITFDHRDRTYRGHAFAEQAKKELEPNGCIIAVAQLVLGDVEWRGARDKMHLMEIKTASDFVTSMKNSHLQDQIARLVQWQQDDDDLRQAHLLISGYLQADDRNYLCYSDNSLGRPNFDDGMVGSRNPQRLSIPSFEPAYRAFAYARAYLTSVKTLGIFVHEGVDPDAFGPNFAAIYNWTMKQSHSMPARRKVRVLEPQIQALMTLSPRMSQPAARNLLHEFGNVINVLNATPAELAEVPKVGPAIIADLFYYVEKELIK